MSSSKKFSSGLNNWVESDKPSMEDFNSDNQILDTAAMWKATYDAASLDILKTGAGIPNYVRKSSVANADAAKKATQLATPRAISLTGAVSGSGTFDGSANLTISTTGAAPNMSQATNVLSAAHGGTGRADAAVQSLFNSSGHKYEYAEKVVTSVSDLSALWYTGLNTATTVVLGVSSLSKSSKYLCYTTMRAPDGRWCFRITDAANVALPNLKLTMTVHYLKL